MVDFAGGHPTNEQGVTPSWRHARRRAGRRPRRRSLPPRRRVPPPVRRPARVGRRGLVSLPMTSPARPPSHRPVPPREAPGTHGFLRTGGSRRCHCRRLSGDADLAVGSGRAAGPAKKLRRALRCQRPAQLSGGPGAGPRCAHRTPEVLDVPGATAGFDNDYHAGRGVSRLSSPTVPSSCCMSRRPAKPGTRAITQKVAELETLGRREIIGPLVDALLMSGTGSCCCPTMYHAVCPSHPCLGSRPFSPLRRRRPRCRWCLRRGGRRRPGSPFLRTLDGSPHRLEAARLVAAPSTGRVLDAAHRSVPVRQHPGTRPEPRALSFGRRAPLTCAAVPVFWFWPHRRRSRWPIVISPAVSAARRSLSSGPPGPSPTEAAQGDDGDMSTQELERSMLDGKDTRGSCTRSRERGAEGTPPEDRWEVRADRRRIPRAPPRAAAMPPGNAVMSSSTRHPHRLSAAGTSDEGDGRPHHPLRRPPGLEGRTSLRSSPKEEALQQRRRRGSGGRPLGRPMRRRRRRQRYDADDGIRRSWHQPTRTRPTRTRPTPDLSTPTQPAPTRSRRASSTMSGPRTVRATRVADAAAGVEAAPKANPDPRSLRENRSRSTEDGLLELHCDEGYGFLRASGYLAGAADVYHVSASQVRRFALAQGRPPPWLSRPQASNERKYPALLRARPHQQHDARRGP